MALNEFPRHIMMGDMPDMGETPDQYLARTAGVRGQELDSRQEISDGGVLRRFFGKIMPKMTFVDEDELKQPHDPGLVAEKPKLLDPEAEHRDRSERLFKLAVLAMADEHQKKRLMQGDTSVLAELSALNEEGEEYPKVIPVYDQDVATDRPKSLRAVMVKVNIYPGGYSRQGEEIVVEVPFDQPESLFRVVSGEEWTEGEVKDTELLQLMAPVRRAGRAGEVTKEELDHFVLFTNRGE